MKKQDEAHKLLHHTAKDHPLFRTACQSLIPPRKMISPIPHVGIPTRLEYGVSRFPLSSLFLLDRKRKRFLAGARNDNAGKAAFSPPSFLGKEAAVAPEIGFALFHLRPTPCPSGIPLPQEGGR